MRHGVVPAIDHTVQIADDPVKCLQETPGGARTRHEVR
jgi:hypothetical protein